MSRNKALEKVGRARVAYTLQQKGWKVGEAFADGYDLLAYHPSKKKACYIELKTMDIDNRSEGVNLTALVSAHEKKTCTHIIAYIEPKGRFFIARKDKILTSKGSIFAALKKDGSFSKPRKDSKSFTPYEDKWDELLK